MHLKKVKNRKILFRLFWRSQTEDMWRGMLFTGLRVTLLHWSHNERVYLGYLAERGLLLKAVPYSFWQSCTLRRQPKD